MNNIYLKYIIKLVEDVNNYSDESYKKALKFKSPNYILGQVIRQYVIPEDHWYISEQAYKVWNKISKDDIWNYEYRKTVKCNCNTTVEAKFYKGREKNGDFRTIPDKICFRDVFHDEHMTDIKSIIDELKRKENLSIKNVQEILDKIYIARILKEEDKKIEKCYGRGTDIEEIKKNIYKPAGIILIPRGEEKNITN